MNPHPVLMWLCWVSHRGLVTVKLSEGTGRFALVLNCPTYGKNGAKSSDQIPGLPLRLELTGSNHRGRTENSYSGQGSSLVDSCFFPYPNHGHITPWPVGIFTPGHTTTGIMERITKCMRMRLPLFPLPYQKPFRRLKHSCILGLFLYWLFCISCV